MFPEDCGRGVTKFRPVGPLPESLAHGTGCRGGYVWRALHRSCALAGETGSCWWGRPKQENARVQAATAGCSVVMPLIKRV